MKPLLLSFIICAAVFAGCNKEKRICNCVPPVIESNLKIIDRSGGISGGHTVLTDDQKNNVLTIRSNGTFSCRNTVTGVIVSGTISLSHNFNSIYGDRTKYVFTPKLPMLTEDFLVLIDNLYGKMTFGDNNADGYLTTFESIP